jgi:hypothetical protein
LLDIYLPVLKAIKEIFTEIFSAIHSLNLPVLAAFYATFFSKPFWIARWSGVAIERPHDVLYSTVQFFASGQRKIGRAQGRKEPHLLFRPVADRCTQFRG